MLRIDMNVKVSDTTILHSSIEARPQNNHCTTCPEHRDFYAVFSIAAGICILLQQLSSFMGTKNTTLTAPGGLHTCAKSQ